MGVDLGGRERSVTQQLLDGAQIRAALEQVRGRGVPQTVRAEIGCVLDRCQVLVDQGTNRPRVDATPPPPEEECRHRSRAATSSREGPPATGRATAGRAARRARCAPWPPCRRPGRCAGPGRGRRGRGRRAPSRGSPSRTAARGWRRHGPRPGRDRPRPARPPASSRSRGLGLTQHLRQRPMRSWARQSRTRVLGRPTRLRYRPTGEPRAADALRATVRPGPARRLLQGQPAAQVGQVELVDASAATAAGRASSSAGEVGAVGPHRPWRQPTLGAEVAFVGDESLRERLRQRVRALARRLLGWHGARDGRHRSTVRADAAGGKPGAPGPDDRFRGGWTRCQRRPERGRSRRHPLGPVPPRPAAAGSRGYGRGRRPLPPPAQARSRGLSAGIASSTRSESGSSESRSRRSGHDAARPARRSARPPRSTSAASVTMRAGSSARASR